MLIPIGFFGGGGAAGSYELISSTILGSNTSSVTFSSIAGSYKHLQVRITNRISDGGTGAGNLSVRLNGDTGSNYAWHHMLGNGSSVDAAGYATQPQMAVEFGSILNGHPANAFGANIIDLVDYVSTSKNKTIRVLAGFSGTSGRIGLASGHWRSTSAVTQIQLFNTNSANFLTGSRFSLYGIKGA